MLQPRVWIKDDEVISLVENIYFNKINKQVTIEDSTFLYYFDDVIFMQNTTMKDVNDKYIYEGDIVRDINTGELFVIRYDLNKAWRVENARCGFRLYNYRDKFEVVGNVFENEELFDEYDFFERVRKELENE